MYPLYKREWLISQLESCLLFQMLGFVFQPHDSQPCLFRSLDSRAALAKQSTTKRAVPPQIVESLPTNFPLIRSTITALQSRLCEPHYLYAWQTKTDRWLCLHISTGLSKGGVGNQHVDRARHVTTLSKCWPTMISMAWRSSWRLSRLQVQCTTLLFR